MVILSFSVKKDELLSGVKIRTTRLYTPVKWEQWKATIPPNNTKVLDLWWRPRTKERLYIGSRPGKDLCYVMFVDLNGRPWPCRSWEDRPITPMSTEEFRQYLKEEGFAGELEQFLRFFEDHYSPLEGRLFQSIAFPPMEEKQ